MNLFHIRYFVKLAEVGHYTKAAQELHITQPSLSHAISQLENELGVPLFEKNGRNTTLTRFGDEFLACAKQTISTLDGGVDSIQREARGDGVIRVGFLRAFGTQFVPQLASQFLKENKDKPILVYCKAGHKSALACEMLEEEGFTKLYNLGQGILGYNGILE